MVKKPGEVGKDFDDYARKWAADSYKMEKAWDGSGVAHSDEALAYPGDEWGGIDDLIALYANLFPKILPGSDKVSVLEIGAGGGRSTRAVVEVLGDRIDEYHVVDVSQIFVNVLRERIEQPIEVHLVDDVDLGGLPKNGFQLCLAQSSWSHINMYDQYRYLRDLRAVLTFGAPLVVNGQFLLGLGNDWAWNRFRRRVYQAEHHVEGVFHEMTGVGVIVEQLVRLEYDIELIHDAGFIARRRQANPLSHLASLTAQIEFPYLPGLPQYAAGQTPRKVTIG
ncbi:MAG TPA: class I SAM-dependent methyltransferase [Acidimicrobiia bacterium]